MKQIIRCIVSVLVIMLFTGCVKNDSPTTEELMEKYSESEQVVIWVYDDYEVLETAVGYFNYRSEQGNVVLKKYSSDDIDLFQFQQKVQAAVMSEDGPDLILSNNPSYMKDIDKIIYAGALSSWNEVISEWDEEMYYCTAIDGVKTANGDIYVLPLSFDIEMIYTSESIQDKYHITKDNFDNIDTLKKLFLHLEHDTLFYGSINFLSCIPKLYDVRNQTTDLLSEPNRSRWADWNQISLKQYTKQNLTFQEQLEMVADETIPFLLSDSSVLLDADAMGLISYPMKDVNSEVIGDIKWYALLPKSTKKNTTINAFLQSFLFDTDSIDYGDGISLSVKRSEKQGYGNMASVLKQPIRLYARTMTRMRFNSDLQNCISASNESDWEELERSINIYLSE